MEIRRTAASKPLETRDELLVASKKVLRGKYHQWEWTKDLDSDQVDKLAVIVGNVLWRAHKKQKDQNRRLKLDPPAPITLQQLEWFMPAQSRTYVGLVIPVE